MSKKKNDFEVTLDDDENFLKEEDYNWDELTTLKNEIGTKLAEFLLQVNSVLENKDIMNNLGEHADNFKRTINLFLKDVNNFSLKIKENRLKHEDKTGNVKTLEEFDEYNRLAMIYHGLFGELIQIITPSMTSIMLIVAEVHDEIRMKELDEQDKVEATEEVVETELEEVVEETTND